MLYIYSFCRPIRRIAKRNYWLRHVCVSVYPTVHPSVTTQQLCYLWMDFHKILVFSILKNMSRKFNFHLNLTRITDTLCSHLVHFFLERGMFQTEVVGKIKTHIMFKNYFRKSCRA